MYSSIGERGLGMIAQDGGRHPGSIIRIFLDGTIPKDNPRFVDLEKSSWLPEIYMIGVRNPQGLAWSPFDNKVYMDQQMIQVLITAGKYSAGVEQIMTQPRSDRSGCLVLPNP